VHLLKEFSCNRITGSGPDYGIHRELRTHCSLAVVDPLNNLRRWKDRHAIETAAGRALLQFGSVKGAMFVGSDGCPRPSAHLRGELQTDLSVAGGRSGKRDGTGRCSFARDRWSPFVILWQHDQKLAFI